MRKRDRPGAWAGNQACAYVDRKAQPDRQSDTEDRNRDKGDRNYGRELYYSIYNIQY